MNFPYLWLPVLYILYLNNDFHFYVYEKVKLNTSNPNKGEKNEN